MRQETGTYGCRGATPPGGGFTLIEVNLAILLIATGMLTLLALFPLGLRQSESAVMDTHESMFATHVLSGLEGNAMSTNMLDWAVWDNAGQFRSTICREVQPVQNFALWDNTDDGVVWPLGSDRRMRYRLRIEPGAENRIWTATLQVKSGVYGDFGDESRFYVTKFVYLGDVAWNDIK